MSLDKNKIFDLIAAGQLDSAIDIIRHAMSEIGFNELKRGLCLICYDFHELTKKSNRGVIKDEIESLERRKIVSRLLGLLSGNGLK